MNKESVLKYLSEIRSSTKSAINQFKDYCLPHEHILEIFNVLLCIDGIETHAEEALELLLTQLPEILHCKDAYFIIESISGLFGGLMNDIIDYNKDLILQAKNIVREEIYYFKLENNLFDKNCNEGELNDMLNKISLDK